MIPIFLSNIKNHDSSINFTLNYLDNLDNSTIKTKEHSIFIDDSKLTKARSFEDIFREEFNYFFKNVIPEHIFYNIDYIGNIRKKETYTCYFDIIVNNFTLIKNILYENSKESLLKQINTIQQII